MFRYFCCDERRRNAVKEHPFLNGIDFLEVFDPGEPPATDPPAVQALKKEYRQRRLFVHLLKEIVSGDLSAGNVLIEGGARIRDLDITRVEIVDAASLPIPELSSPPGSSPPSGTTLMVEVTEPGDFSDYTLRLILEEDQGERYPRPPEGFDPILSAVTFSFKVGCPSDFDCETRQTCPPPVHSEPEINYLAKDYASFRQLMLDRLAVVSPRWQGRLAADLGVALVELLAYVADHLSYQQDAVAAEAYLRTARLRTSVRRHARLVDYRMHDGCNARVWLHLKVRADIPELLLKAEHHGQRTRFFTRVLDPQIASKPIFNLSSPEYQAALDAAPEVFELLLDPNQALSLRPSHNQMQFHTWGEAECCLPRGAVRATLVGRNATGDYLNLALQPGDVLIFQEVKGPATGRPEDADPAHRHAVRLIDVQSAEDPLGDPGASPPEPVPVTQIEWHEKDALPFPLCISAPGIENVSVALGNIVLADHGLTIESEPLSPVTASDPVLNKVAALPPGHCEPVIAEPPPPRYRPRLRSRARARRVENRPLTYAAPFEWDEIPVDPGVSFQPAAHLIAQLPHAALPKVTLTEPGKTDEWEPARDLLNTGPETREFVVETENDGTAYLRFGDGRFGAHPRPGDQLFAQYRVGNGVAGNVGAGAIGHLASGDPAFSSDLLDPVIVAVTNPLSAVGGVEPETLEEVRQKAPAAFRTQRRAVTPDDYVRMAHQCDAGLQSAAATSRWTGSWHTMFLTVDRLAGKSADASYEEMLRSCLEKYRMAGHDLKVDLPRPVPLELEMIVCVLTDYFRADVKRALFERFSNRLLADGSKGVFHPDNFSLGQTVFLSTFYTAAQTVPGVASVDIKRFQRQDHPTNEHLESGRLTLDRLEIARLDNDPNFPERGRFLLRLRGGK